jgi:hypothetical protein
MWDEYLRREQEYASRDPVPLRSATFHAIIQNRPGLRSVSVARSSREIVMAIIVYGSSALLIGAGLIGAVRRH